MRIPLCLKKAVWTTDLYEGLLQCDGLFKHFLHRLAVGILIFLDGGADVLNQYPDLLDGVAAGDEIFHRVNTRLLRSILLRIDKFNVLGYADKER